VAQGRPYKPLFVAGRMEQDQPELRMPFSLIARADGQFVVMNYLDEAGHSRVSLYDAAGKLVQVQAEFDFGTQDQALDTPSNIAEDADKNLYVVDLGTSSIKKFSPQGQWSGTFGREGEGHEEMMNPRDLAVDAQGNIYIADSGNNRILKWDQTGRCLLVMGFEAETTEGYLEPGEEPGQLDEPLSLSVDDEGNTWVADTGNHRIQKFDVQGKFASSFGQQGEIAGQFNYPSNIRLDRQGNIYVADCDGERIQKFDPTGCFIYQIYLPPDTGRLEDFDVNPAGILLIALRKANLVLGLEVQ
jgi:sugar lactone lactonase YvrE